MQAAMLKKLAELCDCVVLTTNQVTPDIVSNNSSVLLSTNNNNNNSNSSSSIITSSSRQCDSGDDPLGLGDVIYY